LNNLAGANLTGTNLNCAEFLDSNLTGANLAGANLNNVFFTYVDTGRFDSLVSGFLIDDPTDWKTTVTGADLSGADLPGAVLTDVDLSSVVGADLTGSILE